MLFGGNTIITLASCHQTRPFIVVLTSSVHKLICDSRVRVSKFVLVEAPRTVGTAGELGPFK